MNAHAVDGLPFDLPGDVIDWIKRAFATCNDHVTAKLSTMPNTYETSLDMAFIEHLSSVSAPLSLRLAG